MRIKNYVSNVKTLVIHGPDCPDGRASALILHDALPGADIRFVQYSTPQHRALEPKPGMLFCDFTPFVERDKSGAMTDEGRAKLAAWVDAGTIVLDHHKGAADVVEAFGERGVFADETKEPGVSGATLAFREVWSAVKGTVCHACRWALPDERHACGDIKRVRDLATLAGIRDTWVKSSPRWNEACAQAAALMFWPWDKLLAAGVNGLAPMLEIGPVLLERDAARDQRTIGEAHRFEVGGVRVVCFEGTHTSDIADKVEVDLIVGWKYLVEGPPEAREQKIVFSTRSRGSFSCLDFAKANGGGGHRNAAGFKLPVQLAHTHDSSPYAVVERLVHDFVRGAR